MTIPASGGISMLHNVVPEFGGPGNLLSYKKGGGHVPTSNINANVPSSGGISLKQLLGSTALPTTTLVVSPITQDYQTEGIQYINNSTGAKSNVCFGNLANISSNLINEINFPSEETSLNLITVYITSNSSPLVWSNGFNSIGLNNPKTNVFTTFYVSNGLNLNAGGNAATFIPNTSYSSANGYQISFNFLSDFVPFYYAGGNNITIVIE